ncbi:MAG: ABC transporter ATP-binding protein [Desulfosarcinaceae bacterium]
MKATDLVKPFFWEHRRSIGLGLLALIGVDFMQLMIPRVLKGVVDDLTLYQASALSLGVYALELLALALMIGLLRYLWRRSLLGSARRLEQVLRNRLFGHIQTLSADYFDGIKTGDLMAHATNDINQIRMAAGMGLVAVNDAVVLGASAIGFMLYMNVSLTLYVMIPMPLIVISTRLLSKRMHRGYQAVQASFADLTETVREHFAGIRMIKAHGGEADSQAAVDRASGAYVDENMKLVSTTALFFPLMMLLTNLSLAAVLLLGGRRTILLQITPGEFVAFISYLNLLTWPMMALGWVTNLIQRGSASLGRLNVILDRRPTIRNAPAPLAMTRVQGRLRFEGVSFAYPSVPDRGVLENITISVEPGRIVGIVGPPGSGKSALLGLVPRIYDVTAGEVSVDGHDVRGVNLTDLRRNMAFVPQEPFLFAGSVRDNLVFGCPEADDDRLKRVIADAGLEETVAAFPHGLETLVGEKGILLSGGQKQRIALARALLIDAPILLLDDPISQVDTSTGARIAATLRTLAGARTVLIVSHRLAAVRFAHEIVSLENGRISEQGNHADLLRAGGYYARVHALQELQDAL